MSSSTWPPARPSPTSWSRPRRSRSSVSSARTGMASSCSCPTLASRRPRSGSKPDHRGQRMRVTPDEPAPHAEGSRNLVAAQEEGDAVLGLAELADQRLRLFAEGQLDERLGAALVEIGRAPAG